MKSRILGAVVLSASLAGGSLSAQTTDTEREAAGAVLEAIDRLQGRLQPEQQAQRLVSRRDADRERILARVDELWQTQMRGISDWIGRHPEFRDLVTS